MNHLRPTVEDLDRAGYGSYSAYLRSDHWHNVKTLAHATLAEECPCGRPGTQLHHRHYRLLGEEWRDLACLQWLCGDCHPFIHDKAPRPKRRSSKGALRTRPGRRKGEGKEALAKALEEMEADAA